ncbi:MAG: hypothetical protein KC912_14950 [Proteobacteria bacterium]|nr:hypothetical protein [Pseudomonadota bacterium]
MSFEADNERQLATSRASAFLAVTALILLATVCCTSIMGVMSGTVLGVISLYLAYSVHGQHLENDARAYTNIGLYGGGAASGLGCAYTLFIMMYVGIYAVMIAAIVLADL